MPAWIAGALALTSLAGSMGGKTKKVVVDRSVQKSAPSRLESFFNTQNQLGDMAVNTQAERYLPDFNALNDLLGASTRNSLAANDAFEEETNPSLFNARKGFENRMETYATTPAQTQKDLMRLGLWSGAAAGGTPRAGSVGQSATRAVYGRGADAEDARRLAVTGNYLASKPQMEVTASPRSVATAVTGYQAGGVDARNARSAAMLDMANDQASQGLSFGEQVLADFINEAKGTAQAQTQVSQLKADQRDKVVGGITNAIGSYLTGGAGSAAGSWLGGLFGGGNQNTPVGGTPGYNPAPNITPRSFNFDNDPFAALYQRPNFYRSY